LVRVRTNPNAGPNLILTILQGTEVALQPRPVPHFKPTRNVRVTDYVVCTSLLYFLVYFCELCSPWGLGKF